MLSEKIVVIDDNPKVIKSIEIGISEYEIKPFYNGEEALAYLRKPNLIHLVLLDIMMPKLDGLSVLEEIKRINKDMAVIMMTAYGSKDIVIQALRSRADDFIEKPFDMNDLKTKIKDLLREKLRYQRYSADKSGHADRMKCFVDRNYKEANLEFISNEMCLSRKYVSRIFGDRNSLSFRDYKVKVKMDKAKDLLRKSHLNVTEIALELGYQNPESFMRIFKRKMKVTPLQYRMENRKMRIKKR